MNRYGWIYVVRDSKCNLFARKHPRATDTIMRSNIIIEILFIKARNFKHKIESFVIHDVSYVFRYNHFNLFHANR